MNNARGASQKKKKKKKAKTYKRRRDPNGATVLATNLQVPLSLDEYIIQSQEISLVILKISCNNEVSSSKFNYF